MGKWTIAATLMMLLGCQAEAAPLAIPPLTTATPASFSQKTHGAISGEILMTILQSNGTYMPGTTRPETPNLQPCIEAPTKPDGPMWLMFSIAIGPESSKVRLLESSPNPTGRVIECVAHVLEGLRNTEGLSRGDGQLVAYVSVR